MHMGPGKLAASPYAESPWDQLGAEALLYLPLLNGYSFFPPSAFPIVARGEYGPNSPRH